MTLESDAVLQSEYFDQALLRVDRSKHSPGQTNREEADSSYETADAKYSFALRDKAYGQRELRATRKRRRARRRKGRLTMCIPTMHAALSTLCGP